MIRNLIVFAVLAIAAATLAQDHQPASASQSQGPAQSTQPIPQASAPAQPVANQAQTPVPGGPATVLKFTSRLVVVDVIATDHKGNPVTDLKRDDFTDRKSVV